MHDMIGSAAGQVHILRGGWCACRMLTKHWVLVSTMALNASTPGAKSNPGEVILALIHGLLRGGTEPYEGPSILF
jgi:hypothetical protein